MDGAASGGLRGGGWPTSLAREWKSCGTNLKPKPGRCLPNEGRGQVGNAAGRQEEAFQRGDSVVPRRVRFTPDKILQKLPANISGTRLRFGIAALSPNLMSASRWNISPGASK
jgi:hypothetical protein